MPGDDAVALVPLPAVLVDAGRIAAANAAAQALLGAAAAPGASLLDAFVADDRPEVTAVLRDGSGSHPVLVRLADPAAANASAPAPAEERWVEVVANRGSDGPHPAVVVLRDATDECFVRAALDALADSTFVLDGTGRNRWRSERLRLRSGVPDDIAITTSAAERIHPEDLPLVFEAFVAATPDLSRSVRARSRSVDDDERWETIEIVAHHRLDHDVLAGYLVQVHNLDEGRTIETSLATADPGLLSLTEAAPVGIVVADPGGHIAYRNPRARELLGPDVQSFGTGDWLVLARPEHREALADALEGALSRDEAATVTAAFLPAGPAPEVWGETAQLTARWLRWAIEPQRTPSGAAGGVIATIEDVTEQVEARAETERLTRMLDEASDLVAVWRPDPYALRWANRASVDHLATAEPHPGQPRVLAMFDASSADRFAGEGMAALAEHQRWSAELVARDPHRGPVPVSVLAVAQRDAAGRLDTVALVARDISELKAAEDRLRHLATHDPLTGLPNRAALTDELEHAVARHRRASDGGGGGLAVLFADLDGFKPVNDRFGHPAGDVVLAEVARRLRATVRDVDVVARLGGDEFVVLCEGTGSDERGVADLATRLHAAVEAPILVEGESVAVGLSVGVAVVPPGRRCDADALLLLADEAMYEAKHAAAAAPAGAGERTRLRVPPHRD